MSTIEQSIDVNVPVSTAYNQWTQFESFPQFMEGVEEVRQLDDTTTHWRVKIGGATREFQAKITEQHPDERIAWRATEGPDQGGVVTFHRLSADTTRVMLQLEYDPDSLTEKVGDALGFVERRIEGDLRHFKQFIESTGQETGAWRGDVPGGSGTATASGGTAFGAGTAGGGTAFGTDTASGGTASGAGYPGPGPTPGPLP